MICFYHLPIILLVALFSVSCGDDPQLVAKREKQKAEITQLKGELALAEEKLKHLPPDISAQLADARKNSAQQAVEVERLETEIAKLEARKQSLQSEFETYQQKYQIK